MDALFCPGHDFILESVKDSSLDYNEPFAFYMNDFIDALCLHIIHETYFWNNKQLYFGCKGDHIARSFDKIWWGYLISSFVIHSCLKVKTPHFFQIFLPRQRKMHMGDVGMYSDRINAVQSFLQVPHIMLWISFVSLRFLKQRRMWSSCPQLE